MVFDLLKNLIVKKLDSEMKWKEMVKKKQIFVKVLIQASRVRSVVLERRNKESRKQINYVKKKFSIEQWKLQEEVGGGR